jgi:hypothetical protein
VTYSAVDGLTVNSPKTNSITAGNILSSASITVNSPALAGVATVTLHNDSGATVCKGTSVSTAQTPNGATSVTFDGINPTDLSAGVDICITLDGTTIVPAGRFTVTVNGEGTVDGTTVLATPVFGDANLPLYDLKKNGSSFRVLNIPPAGVADQAFIRLYNVSSFAGTVLGTLRDAAGTVIGTAGTEVVKLNPREVKVINADTLKSLFGDWTGRSRLFLEADIDQLRVQSLMRSSNVLENMSSEAVD